VAVILVEYQDRMVMTHTFPKSRFF